MSRISVIIPTYNRKDYLSEAIAAIQAQTRPVDEIIVWDDGSSDGTSEAIAQITDPRLQYHQAQNAGKSAALNQAMQHATGDYIWICDDDDLAEPGAGAHLAMVLDTNPDVGVAGGCYQRFSDTDTGRDIIGPGYWPDLSQGTPLRHILEDIYLFQNATMVRRSCYDRVGPFREDLARSIDYEMLVRLATRYPIQMTQDHLFLQRKHDGDRGPAKFRHAASAVENVWAAQDRVVFNSLSDHLPLSLFEAMFTGPAPNVARAALLQRACVYARHDLWNHAIDDLTAATKIVGADDLGPVESDICRRAVSGKHGVYLTPDHMQRITQLKRGSEASQQITRRLGRGLLWSLRKAITNRDGPETIRLLRILRCTGLQMKPKQSTSSIAEVSSLALSAYDW